MHGFCTVFAHRRESRVFPCIVCILCIVAELVGARPLHLAGTRPFCYLKAPLGLSLLRGARKRESFHTFSGEQQAGELMPLVGVHLPDNFQHPFRGDLDAVRQIFFYRHKKKLS